MDVIVESEGRVSSSGSPNRRIGYYSVDGVNGFV